MISVLDNELLPSIQDLLVQDTDGSVEQLVGDTDVISTFAESCISSVDHGYV